MPFDGKDFPLVAVPTVKPFDFDTASPDERLLELARWLEDEQAWRDRLLSWDYYTVKSFCPEAECGTAGCAVGLAETIWPQFLIIDPFDVENRVMTAFDLTVKQGDDLFFGTNLVGFGVEFMHQVTPSMVATAIREFVAART